MMRIVVVVGMVLMAGAWAWGDWTYFSDLDRGVIPHETHKNIKAYLTEKHGEGHRALCLQSSGPGWVTDYSLWHNWTWYDRVTFSMYNENAGPVTMRFEVRTRHERKAQMEFTVKPGKNEVVLRFAEFKNLAEKPFNLWDVGQWVLSFSGALEKPVYLSNCRLIRENIQLPSGSPGNIGKYWVGKGAEAASVKEESDPLPTYWTAMTFAAGQAGTVWLDLRAGEKDLNTYSFMTNWLGYERLTFRMDNGEAGPVKFELLVEDLIAKGCAKGAKSDGTYYEGQLAVAPLEAGAGKTELSVKLVGLKTVDGRRVMDLTQVTRVGFRMVNPEAGRKLSVADVRVRTTNEMAGVLVPKEGARPCKHCWNRLDDANCIVCPFCGQLYNEQAVVTAEVAGSVKLAAVKDASVSAAGGGGESSVNEMSGAGNLTVHHYDESMWEARAFLRFDPSAANIDPRRIKKAELRLHSAGAGNQGKAWLCPMQIFAVPDAVSDFDEPRLSWISQPPVGGFAAQGGLYYYWTDAMALDVTKFLKERLAQSKEAFTLELRAFEAAEVKADAHKFGHHFEIFSREAADENKRPYLYIELE